jgi:methionyl-tRNA synthetase
VFEITQEIRQAIREWAVVPQSIVPEGIRTKIVQELEQRKAEISVSRPTERISWGIKVPGDESQTIYVWLDALVNYLTVTGYPDKIPDTDTFIHVVGKDIAKFHCIYWPAFLLAGGFKPPKQVLNHGHWLMNKQKMSKSLGNVIDPFHIIDTFGVDSVRSYFLAEGPL